MPYVDEHLVHPELLPLLPRLMPVTESGPLTLDMLANMRATVPPFLPRAMATPPWAWHTVPGPSEAPDVRAIVIDPGEAHDAPRPAILHLHGGGYVAGSAEASLWRTQELARELGCVLVSVEYRLAPETPFPGALQDNYAALTWLYRQADTIGVDRDRIALVGESAGGGHAATLAIVARDRGEIPLAYLALIYPMLDDRTGSTARKPPHMGAVLWNAQRNRFGWSCLLGAPAGSGDTVPGAVPARAGDLTGLPPTWIGVGAIDLFLDEDLEFGRRLAEAGVPVRLTVVPGAFHIFDAFGGLAIAQRFRADLVASLRDAFSPR